MKGNKTWILLLLLLSALYAHSQQLDEEQDVIYVHDGSIYRGRIMSAPGQEDYLIEIYGGSTIHIKASDADSVRREPAIVVRDRYTKRLIVPKHEKFTRIEACASLLMYAQQPRLPDTKGLYTFGGGLSFIPEFCKPHRSFSFLVGVAAQIMNTRDYDYTRRYYYTYGTIYSGLHARLEIPVWFRWSWGQRIGMFFQFGLSTGFSCYAGPGEESTYSALGSGQGTMIHKGRFTFYNGFINISTLGFGIRKQLPSHVSFIAYLEGAPANLEFAGSAYMPYMQLHAGINFDPKYFIQNRRKKDH